MTRVALQLYSLRDVEQPMAALLRTAAVAGFDGVEFAYRVTDHDPETVAAAAADAGLDVAGAHVPVEALAADFEETVAFYDALGCSDLVVPYLDDSAFASRDAVDEAVERLARLDDQLADHGMDLHYHNHAHEYVALGDGTGFDAFLDASEFGVELDLGHALRGGDDPAARLDALGNRAALVHARDVDLDADETVPLGSGDLDLAACAATARANGGDWLIYEYDGADPLDTLDQAAATLREHC